jgi:hypothetical protein
MISQAAQDHLAHALLLMSTVPFVPFLQYVPHHPHALRLFDFPSFDARIAYFASSTESR